MLPLTVSRARHVPWRRPAGASRRTRRPRPARDDRGSGISFQRVNAVRGRRLTTGDRQPAAGFPCLVTSGLIVGATRWSPGCSGGSPTGAASDVPLEAQRALERGSPAAPPRSRARPQTSSGSGSTSPGSRRCRTGRPRGRSRSQAMACRRFPHRRSPHVQSRR